LFTVPKFSLRGRPAIWAALLAIPRAGPQFEWLFSRFQKLSLRGWQSIWVALFALPKYFAARLNERQSIWVAFVRNSKRFRCTKYSEFYLLLFANSRNIGWLDCQHLLHIRKAFERFMCYISLLTWFQGSRDHRGTDKHPGRVVTLLPDASEITWGMAYRVSPSQRDRVLEYLDVREKVTNTIWIRFAVG
jgi:hypothetical protein